MSGAPRAVPGRKAALRLFAHLPRSVRLRLVRVIAPLHTVGALCVIEHDGRVLMLLQHHRRGWTLPGGLLDRGETAVQAVVREVAEETGLRIEVDLPVGTIVEPRSRRVDVVFAASSPDDPAVDARGEAFRAAWLRPDEMGTLDEPTADVMALWRRAHEGAHHVGRVLP